ncbi:MAG: VCBS domain-containing protein [Gammaproteobacteria bacterium]
MNQKENTNQDKDNIDKGKVLKTAQNDTIGLISSISNSVRDTDKKVVAHSIEEFLQLSFDELLEEPVVPEALDKFDEIDFGQEGDVNSVALDVPADEFIELSLEELLDVPVRSEATAVNLNYDPPDAGTIQSEGRLTELNPIINSQERDLEIEDERRSPPLQPPELPPVITTIDYSPTALQGLHASLSSLGFVQESNNPGSLKSVTGNLFNFASAGADGFGGFDIFYTPPPGNPGLSDKQYLGNFTIVTDHDGNTLVLNMATGEFTYTLLYPTDHSLFGIDYQFRQFTYTISDLDGDIASNNIVLVIEDDVPIAYPNKDNSNENGLFLANGEHIATGNLLTDGLPDNLSTDPTVISQINGVMDSNNDGIIDAPTSYGTIRVYTRAVGLFVAGDYTYTLIDATSASGPSIDDVIIYQLLDEDGDHHSSNLTITVDLNQSPNAINDSYTTNEDVALTITTPNGVILNNDNDPDLPSDVLTISEINGVAADVGKVVTFTEGDFVTLNADGSLSYDPNGKFETLSLGKSFDRTFSYTLRDVEGLTDSATVTITVEGRNDAPIAFDDTASTNEDTPFTITGAGLLANDVDVDASDVLTVTAINGNPVTIGVPILIGSGALVTIGSYTYDPNNAFEYLAKGQTFIDSFTYQVTDNHGASDTGTAFITITGVNDAPVIGVEDLAGAVVEDAASPNITDSGIINFTDVDLSDAHSASAVFVSTTHSVQLGTLSASITTPATGGATGAVTWNFSVTNAAVQFLAVGQVITETYTVTLSDGNGGIVNRTVLVTLTGTNDIPVIGVEDLAGAVVEDAASPNITDSGIINFTDVDLSDAHSASAVFVSTTHTAQLGALSASVTTPATGGATGAVTWNFSVTNAAVQFLAVGQVITETYTVTLNDGNGGIVNRTVLVTLTGTNDIPVIGVEDLAGAVVEDAASPNITDSGIINFTDVDLSDAHSASAVFVSTTHSIQLGTLSASITTPATGGAVTWNGAAVQFLAVGQVITETYFKRCNRQ